MSNTPSDTQEHSQHNFLGHYNIADLAVSIAGSGVLSGTVTSSTMQMHDARFGMGPNLPEQFATRSIAITSPLQGYGVAHPSYHSMIQNNYARTDAYNTPPPPLPRIVSIPLPPLSPNVPIRIHALITYRPSTSPIYWNISYPPPTALLAMVDSSIGSRSRWSRDVAVVPSLSSFTIRMRGIARPVVILPIEAGLPIRIVDIMRAVYNAIRAQALESDVGASGVLAHGAHGQGSRRDLTYDDAMAADAIRRHFRNRVWWNGLSQSMNEVDVWVLHLRGPSCGRFRW